MNPAQAYLWHERITTGALWITSFALLYFAHGFAYGAWLVAIVAAYLAEWTTFDRAWKRANPGTKRPRMSWNVRERRATGADRLRLAAVVGYFTGLLFRWDGVRTVAFLALLWSMAWQFDERRREGKARA